MALQRGNAVSFQNTMITEWNVVAAIYVVYSLYFCIVLFTRFNKLNDDDDLLRQLYASLGLIREDDNDEDDDDDCDRDEITRLLWIQYENSAGFVVRLYSDHVLVASSSAGMDFRVHSRVAISIQFPVPVPVTWDFHAKNGKREFQFPKLASVASWCCMCYYVISLWQLWLYWDLVMWTWRVVSEAAQCWLGKTTRRSATSGRWDQSDAAR